MMRVRNQPIACAQNNFGAGRGYGVAGQQHIPGIPNRCIKNRAKRCRRQVMPAASQVSF
jgi:hypothetical protein